MITARISKALRQGWGLAIYRGLATFFLFCAGFSAFPENVPFVALAVIVFRANVLSLVEFLTITHLAEERKADQAERKTRHTILEAQRLPPASEFEEPEFWDRINVRVAEEMGPPDDPLPFWKSFGLTGWNVVQRLFGDLAAIVIALIVTGTG